MKQTDIHAYLPMRYMPQTDGAITRCKVSVEDIVQVCKDLYLNDAVELKIITATDARKAGRGFQIFYVFGVTKKNIFIIPYIEIEEGEEFPSLTPHIHEAALYERKIHTFFGLKPVGHPDLRPLILHENFPKDAFPLRKDARVKTTSSEGAYAYAHVGGEGVYEIPVGPVHAGIIEPGHFRFSVLGEEILLLEPRLGYTHKGIEKLFEQLPLPEKVRLSERVSGDTSFTHSLAFCQALECLSHTPVPPRAHYVRTVFSELERLANHVNDIGFILQDTGYGFGGASGMRLRELILQWHERLTGNRFLRGVNIPGGVTRDITRADAFALRADLDAIRADFEEVIEIALDSSSVVNRLEGTGVLPLEVAIDHGCLGVVGRAMGIMRDARIDYPHAAYADCTFDIALEKSGDVAARLNVRVKEVRTSITIIEQALAKLPAGAIHAQPKSFPAQGIGIGIAEGWRGDIVYFVMTDGEGAILRVAVRDASFLNWPALGVAGMGNVVPDFPLINKSFNLSYSGNDL